MNDTLNFLVDQSRLDLTFFQGVLVQAIFWIEPIWMFCIGFPIRDFPPHLKLDKKFFLISIYPQIGACMEINK